MVAVESVTTRHLQIGFKFLSRPPIPLQAPCLRVYDKPSKSVKTMIEGVGSMLYPLVSSLVTTVIQP